MPPRAHVTESRVRWVHLHESGDGGGATDLVLGRSIRHFLRVWYNPPSLGYKSGQNHTDEFIMHIQPWKGQGLYSFTFFLSPETLAAFLGEVPQMAWEGVVWGQHAYGRALPIPSGGLLPTKERGLPRELSREEICAVKKLCPEVESIRHYRDASGVLVRMAFLDNGNGPSRSPSGAIVSKSWTEEGKKYEVQEVLAVPTPRLQGAVPTRDRCNSIGLALFSVSTGPVLGYPGVALFVQRSFLKKSLRHDSAWKWRTSQM